LYVSADLRCKDVKLQSFLEGIGEKYMKSKSITGVTRKNVLDWLLSDREEIM